MVVSEYHSFVQAGVSHTGHSFTQAGTNPTLAQAGLTTSRLRFELQPYTLVEASVGVTKGNLSASLIRREFDQFECQHVYQYGPVHRRGNAAAPENHRGKLRLQVLSAGQRGMADPVTAVGAPEAIEAELQKIRTLIEERAYEAALSAAQQLAAGSPTNRDVLYSIAVCQRCLRHEPDALQTLERLQALHPGYSRLYQEIGYCRVGLRDGPAAVEAFLKAVNRNPALPGSWAMLERLYRMVGDAAGAKAAAGHVAILAEMPAEIVTATSMFSDREFDAAEKLVRGYLLSHGNHVEAMRLLARLAIEKDARDEAELLLGAVLEMAPDYRAARFDYATVLLKRHRHRRPLVELDRICKAEPANRAYQTTFATACVGLGRFEQALAIYRQLLQSGPPNAELQLSIGHCLKTMGDSGAAIQAYREAVHSRRASAMPTGAWPT